MNGRRLGVDVGSVRVGVAMSDPAGVLASPLATLSRDEVGDTDVADLVALVVEHEVVEVIVGLPRTLADRHGSAAQAAQDYAALVREFLDGAGRSSDQVPVTLSDERLTTVAATRMLSDRGVRGRRQRAVIDQAAAAAILQGHLDRRRASDSSDTPDDGSDDDTTGAR